MLQVLDLFSGIGGFSLGLEKTGGFRTIGFCEKEEYCKKVLRKHWPEIPIYGDIRLLETRHIRERVDVITGGYPCQPFSEAGLRKGFEDDRHLWPEMYRLVSEIRPTWVIGENVTGHISMGLKDVLSDLENIGYQFSVFNIPACAVDAPHRRSRIWIIARNMANSKKQRLEEYRFDESKNAIHTDKRKKNVADAHQQRPQRQRGFIEEWNSDKLSTRKSSKTLDRGRKPQSRLGGMAYGIPTWMDEPLNISRLTKTRKHRVSRIKALGNAVVPQVVERIGYAILEADKGPA